MAYSISAECTAPRAGGGGVPAGPVPLTTPPANPDAVSVLLDGRMRFQFTDAALHVAEGEPVVPRLENPVNADRTGGTGSDMYAARIGSQVEIRSEERRVGKECRSPRS